MESTPFIELKTEQAFHCFLRFLRNNKFSFLSAIVVGLLAHGYAFTNKLLNSDDLRQLFTKGYTVDSGRWGLELMSFLFPDVSMPWIYGIISVFLIAVACCLIVNLFCVRNKIFQCLLSALVVSFPSLTGTFAYMFTSSSYVVALLLSVYSVYLYCSTNRNAWKVAAALAACVVSTGIYQAYIAVTASFHVLILIQKLLHGEEKEKDILLQGIYSVLFLATSLALYWIISQVCFSITGISMNAYSQDALSFQPSKILANIVDAYRYFLSTFVYFKSGIISGSLSRILHFVCIALIGIEIMLWLLQNRRRVLRILLMLFLLLMLPLSMNCIHLFIAPQNIHTLVMYSFISIYIFAVIVIENGLFHVLKHPALNRIRNISFDAIAICMSIVIMCNIYAANKAYLSLYLHYENYYAFCNSIIAQLQSIPEYTQDTEVAMIGGLDHPDFYYEHFEDIFRITGTDGVHPSISAKWKMFEYYIGYDVKVASADKIQHLETTDSFKSMPAYPNHGYVQMIDDTIVIKLPD